MVGPSSFKLMPNDKRAINKQQQSNVKTNSFIIFSSKKRNRRKKANGVENEDSVDSAINDAELQAGCNFSIQVSLFIMFQEIIRIKLGNPCFM